MFKNNYFAEYLRRAASAFVRSTFFKIKNKAVSFITSKNSLVSQNSVS